MERGPSPEGPDVCTCGHARDRHGLTTKPEHRDGPCQVPGCDCPPYAADRSDDSAHEIIKLDCSGH